MKRYFFQKLFLFGFVLLGLSACSSTPTTEARYFSLTPIQTTEIIPAVATDLSLGIGPVEIPRMLNRPQIIYRKNNNEILLSEQNQWAGSLREEIQGILIERAMQVSGSQAIMHYPWARDLRPEFEARIRIDRLDGELGKEIILEAHWDLLTQKDKRLITSRKSRHQINLESNDFLSYVVAQQAALTKLADEIVAEVISFQSLDKH